MSGHRYKLETYKGLNSRYICPGCQQKGRTFVRYIDTETSLHVASNVGRCNRESSCGYHYTPKQYFQDNNISFENRVPVAYLKSKSLATPKRQPSFIPEAFFKSSLQRHEENNFVKYLIKLFGSEVASQAISRYFIGTSKYQFISKEFSGYRSEKGAVVFWQVDITGKVRTGKIMLYDSATGKRVKEPISHINWVHSALKLPDYNLDQCLFGEHLLQDKTKPIALVESEKTAIIASVYFPKFHWLAVGSLEGLNAGKCSVLKGLNVTLFPDLKGYDKWSKKALELSNIATFTISGLLEQSATNEERNKGFDLADFLVQFDYKEFATPEPEPKSDPIPPPEFATFAEAEYPDPIEYPLEQNYLPKQPEVIETWEQEIISLESFFETVILPTQPIKMNAYTTITDVSKFIQAHMEVEKAQVGKRTYGPYLERLKELMT